MSLKIAILLFSLTVLSNPLSRRQVGPDSKAGLAWPNGPYSDTEQYATTGKVSWCVYTTHTFAKLDQIVNFKRYYTWSPNSIDTPLEYVPMLWGERQIEQWTNTINQTIRTRRSTHALGFNE